LEPFRTAQTKATDQGTLSATPSAGPTTGSPTSRRSGARWRSWRPPSWLSCPRCQRRWCHCGH